MIPLEFKYVDQFFSNHQELLSKSYPGLNSRILWMKLFGSRVFHLDYWLECTEQILKGVPLEYISGETFFYKFNFYVDRGVLIPRNETEILVELAVSRIKKNNFVNIIDIGTGSGAIGLSVLCEIDTPLNFAFSDISSSALQLAKLNLKKLAYNLDSNHAVEFIEQDRLEKSSQSSFDLVLTNPPYIHSQKDRHLVHENVLNYEPELALFIDDEEYMNWFSRFFKEIYDRLKLNGEFIMEGHELYLDDLSDLAQSFGFKDLRVLKDLSGAKRFLHGKK